jgi:hypothetical protein
MATVRITWTDSVTPETEGYKIYRDDIEIGDVGTGVQTFDDVNAVDGETYKYEVQGYSPTGESTDEVEGSNVINFEVIPPVQADYYVSSSDGDDNDDGLTPDTAWQTLTKSIEGMVAGRGWIVIALTIFATWNPARAFLGAFLFGGISVLQYTLQPLGISPNILNMLPYITTLIVLFIGVSENMKSRIGAPAALGFPYNKGEK